MCFLIFYIGLHKVEELTLYWSRHNIALKCTKIQEFACNFEKFVGARETSSGGGDPHPQYGLRQYVGAAPPCSRTVPLQKDPIYTPEGKFTQQLLDPFW